MLSGFTLGRTVSAQRPVQHLVHDAGYAERSIYCTKQNYGSHILERFDIDAFILIPVEVYICKWFCSSVQ